MRASLHVVSVELTLSFTTILIYHFKRLQRMRFHYGAAAR